MKKALHENKEVFFYQSDDGIRIWDPTSFLEEIVEYANKSLGAATSSNSPEDMVSSSLYYWFCRYDNEGLTDAFYNDLNSTVAQIPYSKVVIPTELIPTHDDTPSNAYLPWKNTTVSPEAYAADDFSKLLTSGELERLKRCQSEGCGKLFIGRPDGKWCSRSCGSKQRVRNKRKKDAAR